MDEHAPGVSQRGDKKRCGGTGGRAEDGVADGRAFGRANPDDWIAGEVAVARGLREVRDVRGVPLDALLPAARKLEDWHEGLARGLCFILGDRRLRERLKVL